MASSTQFDQPAQKAVIFERVSEYDKKEYISAWKVEEIPVIVNQV